MRLTELVQSRIRFCAWAVASLSVAWFHEPWRDEAQAWLVARNSQSLWDLWIRSSAEATGPVYYLLLRPFALWFPDAFPSAIFWVSWAGTAAFAWNFSHTRWVPNSWRWLVLFGTVFGYEYPVIARLYGWGCFFFWKAICADYPSTGAANTSVACVSHRYRTSLWLGLSVLVQLSFLVLALSYALFRGLRQELSWRSLPRGLDSVLVIFLGVALWHLSVGAPLRTWGWADHPKGIWGALGTAIAAPFLHGPRLGWTGLAFAAVPILSLRGPALISFLSALSGFIFLFVFRYRGFPEVRHAGPYFLLWVGLVALGGRPFPKWIFWLLTVNVLASVWPRLQDIRYPFSDSTRAAATIQSNTNGRDLLVFANCTECATSIAALLGVPVWKGDKLAGCPFFPPACQDPGPAPVHWDLSRCQTHWCLFISPPQEKLLPAANSPIRGEWKKLYSSDPRTLREPLQVHEWVPAPKP